jgi:hypothetical protein
MVRILAVLLVAGVFVYSWYRNDLRRLARDYASEGPFDGTLKYCLLRFPLDDTSTECMLGANGDGLYLSSSNEALERNRRWSFRYHVIATPIFIPWDCVQVSDARFPMRGHLRFSVPSNHAIFFIPRDTARQLLASVGR